MFNFRLSIVLTFSCMAHTFMQAAQVKSESNHMDNQVALENAMVSYIETGDFVARDKVVSLTKAGTMLSFPTLNSLKNEYINNKYAQKKWAYNNIIETYIVTLEDSESLKTECNAYNQELASQLSNNLQEPIPVKDLHRIINEYTKVSVEEFIISKNYWSLIIHP